MKTAFLTDIGKKRENNQDYVNVFKNKSDVVFGIVADGMGGHLGGDVASDMAVSHLGHDFEKSDFNDLTKIEDWLLGELKSENQRIIETSNQFSDLTGMGTTIVGVALLNKQILVSNVGDSRCYVYQKGNLKQLSFDHSLVNELVESGEISEEEARVHPQKNIITQTLGVNNKVKPESNIFDINSGDLLLLCTDGLTNMISNEDIANVLAEDSNIDVKCEKLVHMANEAGGLDNITVLIIEVEDSEED